MTRTRCHRCIEEAKVAYSGRLRAANRWLQKDNSKRPFAKKKKRKGETRRECPPADAQRGRESSKSPTGLTLLCDIFMCKTHAVMASSPQPPLRIFFFLLLLRPLAAQIAHGPLPDGDVHHPRMGWVTDHAKSLAPSVVAGVLSVQGDTRVYLVQDYTKRDWEQHQYMRLDLSAKALEFTLDLSKVPCGCLACVYLVAMKDPDPNGANYW